jgi:hypothetical protein
MSSAVIEQGQFDDPLTDRHPEGILRGYDYIDEALLEQVEEDSEGDDHTYSEGSDDDFTRVEDEDWEIAEKGKRLDPSSPYTSYDISS